MYWITVVSPHLNYVNFEIWICFDSNQFNLNWWHFPLTPQTVRSIIPFKTECSTVQYRHRVNHILRYLMRTGTWLSADSAYYTDRIHANTHARIHLDVSLKQDNHIRFRKFHAPYYISYSRPLGISWSIAPMNCHRIGFAASFSRPLNVVQINIWLTLRLMRSTKRYLRWVNMKLIF